MIGLLLSAPIWVLVYGQSSVQTVSDNLPLLGAAGILVGFGSILGNGCTSGHGVCGYIKTVGSLHRGHRHLYELSIHCSPAASPRNWSIRLWKKPRNPNCGPNVWHRTHSVWHGQPCQSAKLPRFVWHVGPEPCLRYGGGHCRHNAWLLAGHTDVQNRSLTTCFTCQHAQIFDKRLVSGAAIFGLGWGAGWVLSGSGRHCSAIGRPRNHCFCCHDVDWDGGCKILRPMAGSPGLGFGRKNVTIVRAQYVSHSFEYLTTA